MTTETRTSYPVVETFSEHLPLPFVDEVSATEKYIGYAPLGVDEGTEGWRLIKEQKIGTVTKRLYAEGTSDFRFAWEKRKTYRYTR